jgi:hypothetical protein
MTEANHRIVKTNGIRMGSWQPSLYLCGAVGGIGGLAYGTTDGGWAFAINSRNLIIVGRCSPSLQPKRQARLRVRYVCKGERSAQKIRAGSVTRG